MEIRVLEYFLMVAREENITRAAQQLHMTQPSLSRQLMKLEEELQTPLLIRGKRKIELTEAGRILRRRAQEIVDMIAKTEQEVRQNEQMIGQITIGTGIFEASQSFLPHVMEQFMKDHPQVKFDIYTGNADLIKEKLDEGTVDIGILMEPVNIEKYHFIRLLRKEKWGIIISEDHQLAQYEKVKAAMLGNVNLFNTNRMTVQNEVSNWLSDGLKHIDFPVTYNFNTTVLPLIQKNLGAVITIEGAYRAENHEHLVFLPFDPVLETGVVIVWKKDTVLSNILKKFITLMESISKEY